MIRNLTKNKVISGKKIFAENFFSKSIGLMFSRKSCKSLIFAFKKERIVPLHMLFVFYPIDVLFLDKNKRIVEIKENFRPFTFYMPKKKAKFVIELSNNTIRDKNIQINDKLKF